MSQSSAARIINDVPNFDVVDAITPVASAPCAECRAPIADTYFESDAGVICDACHTRIAADVATRMADGRFSRALVFGVAAALVGAAIYFATLGVVGHDVTLVVLLVGVVVGKGVRIGARGRGGRRYQWLAIGLTYLAIASTYLPFVLKGFTRASAATTAVTAPASTGDAFLVVGTPAATSAPPRSSLGNAAADFGGLVLLALVAPVLESANHPLALLIFAIALGVAWRANRRTALRMTGPYHVRF